MGFEFSEEDVRRQIQGDGSGGSGVLRSSAKALVTFRMWAAQDSVKTAERGYPAFRDTVYFSRRGEKNDGVDKEATDVHFKEYPAEYAAFKEWMKDPQFPVYVLPYLPPHVLRLLDAGEITTVQELANAPNLIFRDPEGNVAQRVAVDSVPELIEPRRLAREWLGKRPQKPVEALPETETERLQRELAELKAQLAKPKRGGRKLGSKNKPKVPRGQDAQADS